jgi:hypothetical protein
MLLGVWNPQGLQWWVGELLHWVNPLIFLIFWLIFVDKKSLAYRQIPKWLLFPAGYFVWVIIYGALGFGYPYPFFNPEKIGWLNVLNSGIALLFVLTILSVFLIFLGKILLNLNVSKADTTQNNSY